MNDPLDADLWLPPFLSSAQDESALSDFPELVPSDFLATHGLETGLDSIEQPLSPCLSDDELEKLFEPPARQTASMRTAFSLNDLQTLELEPQPTWHRTASIKPTLESVPEGDPPPVSHEPSGMGPSNSMLYPQQPVQYQASPTQQPAAGQHVSQLPYMTQPPMPHYHHETCYVPGMVTGPVYPGTSGYPGHAVQPLHGALPLSGHVPMPGHLPLPGHMPMPMPSSMPMAGSTMAPSLPPVTSSPRSPLPMAMMQTRSSNPGSELGTPAHGFHVQGSPEHQMVDAVKPDPSPDTDSSANSQPRKLQPSVATMRKSYSALELGAWRKMAAGDLDFVDPNGSVRETLQGLGTCQHVGKLTAEERLQKILRYRAKRQLRNFNRTIKYQCRKSLADTRPRVRGRFARDNEPGSVLPHETKKAQREKLTTAAPTATKTKSPPPSTQPSGQLQERAEQPPLAEAQTQPQQSPQAKLAVPAPPPLAVKEETPFVPTPAQSGPFLVHASSASSLAHGDMPGPEHNVTALAHLYNQWSEIADPEMAKG